MRHMLWHEANTEADLSLALFTYGMRRCGQEAEVQRQRCKGPERHLNYCFKDKTLMMEAFTHCSWPDPHPQCYQRLEFVGDAVLDLLITRAIVTSYR